MAQSETTLRCGPSSPLVAPPLFIFLILSRMNAEVVWRAGKRYPLHPLFGDVQPQYTLDGRESLHFDYLSDRPDEKKSVLLRPTPPTARIGLSFSPSEDGLRVLRPKSAHYFVFHRDDFEKVEIEGQRLFRFFPDPRRPTTHLFLHILVDIDYKRLVSILAGIHPFDGHANSKPKRKSSNVPQP